MKNLFLKATFEVLDFAEYFCSKAKDKEMLWTFVGNKEFERALTFQTLNPEYSARIARMYGFNPEVFTIDKRDVEQLVKTTSENISKKTKEYLENRKFPLDLCKKYSVGSFKFSDYKDYDFGTMKNYWLFNAKRLDYLNFLLSEAKFDLDLNELEFMTVPSYDSEGKINNIALRVLNEKVEKEIFKWLFTHGRCATFGLENCEKGKTATIVEGFFDYVACNESGMKNIVGLGSAYFSEEHIKEISKVTDKINIMFDNDETGIKHRVEPNGLILENVLYYDSNYKDPYELWIGKHKVEIEIK